MQATAKNVLRGKEADEGEETEETENPSSSIGGTKSFQAQCTNEGGGESFLMRKLPDDDQHGRAQSNTHVWFASWGGGPQVCNQHALAHCTRTQTHTQSHTHKDLSIDT